jgi:UDP-N-acetylglucosamine--N-acetylmuramyl-(pentapeptide) pyrophosphoryl-undecaprenol N-acetylglucosamine transferase
MGAPMNLLLTGGGTGGHVYPALALADAARRRDPAVRVLFVGSAVGMEASLVPAAGIPFAGLAVRPPRGRAPLRIAIALATGAASLIQVIPIMARFRPDAIVATGGIAAAPAVVIGAACRVPVVVLEGNTMPGRINRVLGRMSRIIAVGSDATAKHFPGRRVAITGLPVRREVYAATREDGLRSFGLDPARRTVLILGGSQGAARLNRAAEEALAFLGHREDLQVLHQVGRGWSGPPLGPGRQGSGETFRGGRVPVVRVPYLEPIGPAYACADLVVSRCGATAVAEIAACGKPALLIPYPFAAEDHQTHNAAPLVEAGAAVLIGDGALNGETLAREIAALLDAPERLAGMAARARAFGRPDAADRVMGVLGDICRLREAPQEVHG